MPRLLIASAREDFCRLCREVFGEAFDLLFVSRSESAAEPLSLSGFDAVLSDGDPALARAAREAGTLALYAGEDDLSHEGIYTLASDRREALEGAKRHLVSTGAILAALSREKDHLQKKLEDLTLCNRAKAVLCRTLGFSEDQAHKYLERQAMARRITKTEAAKIILSTYEN